MVSLTYVIASNARISSSLPSGLVAVFVGATSGIGEITLKKFAKYTAKPRIYFVGRSQEAADRIHEDCKSINPEGQFSFIKADVSLINVVDVVCKEIKAKESGLNLLFLSAGVPSMDRSLTSENLHLLASLNYYSRLRFIEQLLPLIKASRSLRRIVTVGGGGEEGPLDATDFPALRVPLLALRSHLTTLITLGLEAVAKTAPEVSFVHDYPGTVPTPFLNFMSEEQLAPYMSSLVPVEESGERHVFIATSARFPAKQAGDGEAGVELESPVAAALGVSGEVGSGVYSLGKDCDCASVAVIELLAGLRRDGMVERIWDHTQAEFSRITKQVVGL